MRAQVGSRTGSKTGSQDCLRGGKAGGRGSQPVNSWVLSFAWGLK